MSNGTWNPSSEDKLEGSPYAMIPQEMPVMAGQSTTIGEQQGMRLPMAPKPVNGEIRPELPLIRARILGRVAPLDDDDLLQLSRQSFNNSETYFNASHRTRVIDAMARFNSEHPKGSKYWNPAFEKRSRLFRPKTRSTIRKREAAAAISLFASSDIVNVKAASGEIDAAEDARIQEALLDYRLQQDDRWYRFVVGSVQDSDRQGFAVARTYWDYDEANKYYKEAHPELGVVDRVDTVPTKDRPGFTLIPIERFHFSPAADWVDPVNTSPYVIEEIPMYVCDVRRYAANPRARLKYRDLSVGELLSGGKSGDYDGIRTQRERNGQNRYDRGSENSDYAIVWVHRNIMKLEGEDYVFDTVGTTIMLSNVIPLSEFDPRGYRPYVVGSTVLEAHNPFNYGMASLMGNVQDEINDVANLRQDATKMATSGRMFVKRNSGLDLHALARFAPGAAVEMDNPASDVKWDKSPEAPQGAFEENQLLNVELDDLAGNFSQQSVANNRNLNETVGGMQMLGDSSNQLTEYDLHTFCKTFLTKVLMQIMDLEKTWESDAALATILGSRMAVNARRFWKSLGTESVVTVNVGFGATNPAKRIERMDLAFGTIQKYMPYAMMGADQLEMTKEIMAAAGISDVSRFFPNLDSKDMPKDPKMRQLMQQNQQLMSMTYAIDAKIKGATEVAQLRVQSMEKIAQMNNAAAQNLKNMELRLAYVELQIEHEKNDIARGQLMLERERLSNDITIQRLEFNLQQATAVASLSPPTVALPADAEAKSKELSAPGSNVSSPTFGQDFGTAGEYVAQSRKESA